MGKKTIAKEGRNVRVHYKGTLNDGTVFDSSYDRGETINFTVGGGQMIPGFENAIDGMRVGETKKVSLTPNESYGDYDPNAIRDVPKTSFPEDFDFIEGGVVAGTANGMPLKGTINEVKDDTVLIDFNHPMAGKDLNFEIELVEVEN